MSIRVLIADDNEVIRRLIRRSLEKRGDIEICAQTSDGRETVAAATALKPDLLILDVRMPELNGIEVAALLKKELPNAKAILFTMYDDCVGQSLAAAAGVHRVLPKPDGISKLLIAVEDLLGAEQVFDSKQGLTNNDATKIPNVRAVSSSNC